jgi:hypothetical protein
MNFPLDPMAQHNRLIEAVCNGLRNGDYREAQAVALIARKIRKEGDK